MPQSVPEDFLNREFPMTDRDFDQIRETAYSLTGIKLSDHKKNMIYGRLARQLRRLRMRDFNQYLSMLKKGDQNEEIAFINAITTNLTSFFRENHHFEYLKNSAFPNIILKNSTAKKLRIWSAGCSTGEEPYSIAMVVKSMPQFRNWDVKILATDLDSNVLQKASNGEYSPERIENIPHEYKKYFDEIQSSGNVRVVNNVRELVRFRQLNLLRDWPMKNSFDIIFCRNVVIYFDAETQRVLFDRYANILKPKAYLFIGHSESLHNITDRFDALGRTIYEKGR